MNAGNTGSPITAAVLRRLAQPLVIESLALPELGPGMVEVEITFSGVCRSQYLEVRGLRGNDPYLPHTLGHEGSGVVRNIGSGVTKVQPGDRVVLTWIQGAGMNVPSIKYTSETGPVNSGGVSTFMTSAVVAENRVVPIDDEVPLDIAALLGCAVPTGAGAILNTANVTPGTSVAVFGAGGVGLCAIAAARAVDAGLIIAVDVTADKLELARAMGATELVNAWEEDVPQAIKDLTGGVGVDFAVEAAGRTDAMETALASTRAGGGVCVLAGNPPHGERITIDPFELIHGKRLIGTTGGGTDPDQDIPRYSRMISEGTLELSPLLDRSYPLARINDAFDDMESGKTGRAMIDMSLK